jgi:hypothetical protein
MKKYSVFLILVIPISGIYSQTLVSTYDFTPASVFNGFGAYTDKRTLRIGLSN